MRPLQVDIPIKELETLFNWIDSEALECAELIAREQTQHITLVLQKVKTFMLQIIGECGIIKMLSQ